MDNNRKAELFDRLVKGIEGKFSKGELYELLRISCGMSEAEIKEAGIPFADASLQREDASPGAMPGILAKFKISNLPCKLKDMLKSPLPNSTYLEHNLHDIGFLPVGGLCIEDMIPKEQEEWADVLDADVHRIFPGAYGTHLEVGGVESERLTEFSCIVGFGAINKPMPPRSIYAITSNAQTSYYKTEKFESLMELISLLREVHTAKDRVPSTRTGNAERLVLYSKGLIPFSPSGHLRLFQPLEPDLYAVLLKQFSEKGTADRHVILDYDSNQLSFTEWQHAEPITMCGPLDGIISAYSGALRKKGGKQRYVNEKEFYSEIERICEIGPLKPQQDDDQHLGMNLEL